MLELALFAKDYLKFYKVKWFKYGYCEAAFSRCFKDFYSFANILLHISLKMKSKVKKIF